MKRIEEKELSLSLFFFFFLFKAEISSSRRWSSLQEINIRALLMICIQLYNYTLIPNNNSAADGRAKCFLSALITWGRVAD